MSIRGKLTDKPFCLATHAAGSIARNLCKIRGGLLLLLLLFATSSLRAQTSYPVQVNVMVTPPNSVYLTDYYTRGSERLKVQLLLKEVSRPSFPVKLRFRIEGSALRLNSRSGVNLPPFTLQGGVMVEAAGDALAPYLGLNALVAEGADASSFQSKGQRMADGFYKVEVWAEEMGRSVRVSNIATTFISTMLYQSPLITSPTDRAVLPDQGIQNIVFQWMPRHLGASADVTQSTYYKLKLVEVWPTDRDPQEAIRSSKPLYEGMSTSTTFVYGPSQPTLISGRRYALQVQAQDADQRDLFVGQGYSNVVCFTYGEECQIPQGLNVEVKGPNNATVIWNAYPKSTGYTFAYRKVYGSDTTWKEQPLGVPTYGLDGLVAESSYQVRVAASCGLAKSLWCQPRSFTTPDKPDTKFECGKNPDIPNITDRTLYPNLKDGDRIQAADFKVEVLTASLDNNGYSGSGIARIPFLRNAPAFCYFKGAKINKDLQLYEGSIVLADSVTVINKKMVDGAVKLGNDVLNSLKNKNPNSTVIVAPVSGTITATSTATSGAGADTFISGGKTTVTVTTSTGQTVTSTPGTNTKVVDDAGNVVAVSQNGVFSKGKHDKDAFGKGVTNSEAAQVATDAKLPKVTFALDTSKPYYGYDTSSGSGPWVSIATGKSVSINASVDLQQSKHKLEDIRYRTNDGMVVEATGTNPAILDVKGLYSNTAIPILAVADTGKVDSLKTAFICGKINTVGYDPEHRRVWLVPVNGAKVNKDAIAKKLNEVYRHAVVEWDVQYDPAIMSLTLTDDEKANLCKDIDVGLVTNYTLGMQAALRKLAQEPEDKNFLLFMVDAKAGDATGFMPLNRSAGFIFMQGQNSNAVARTVAHELGHGAFGLEHVGSAKKDANLAATDNLMDYNGGTTLDKGQWDAIHSEHRRITWFQGEDEGMYYNVNIMVTPSGVPFDIGNTADYIFYFNTESYKVGDYPVGSVLAFKEKSEPDSKVYIARLEKGKFIGYFQKGNNTPFGHIITPKSNTLKVVIFHQVDSCISRAFIVDYKVRKNNDGTVLKQLDYDITKASFLKEFDNCTEEKQKNTCDPKYTNYQIKNIRTKSKGTPNELATAINTACQTSVGIFSIKERFNFIETLNTGTVLNAKELAILKVLKSFNPASEGDSVLSYLSENKYKRLSILLSNLNDDWTLANLTNDSYGQFLVVLRDIIAGSKSYADRKKSLEDDFANRVVNWGSGTNQSLRVNAAWDESTGKVVAEFSQSSHSYSPVGSSGENWTVQNTSPYDPFELVMLVNHSDLTNVEASGIQKGEALVVPSIFLKYLNDKQANDKWKTVGLVALDAATIASSGGLALTTKVSWLRRLWYMGEVAGSFGNISLNTNGIPNDLKPALDAYNKVCGYLGVYSIAKLGGHGLAKAASLETNLAAIRKYAREQYLSTIFGLELKIRSSQYAKQLVPVLEKTEELAKKLRYSDDEIRAMRGAAKWIDADITAILKSVSRENITEASIAQSRKALGSLADKLSDDQIVDIVKMNYLASGQLMEKDKKLLSTTPELLEKIRTELTAISKQVGLPQKDALLSRIMHASRLKGIEEGVEFIPVELKYRNITGYIGRNEDFSPVSMKQLIKDYRLDYETSEFTRMPDDGYVVIKFRNTDPDKVDFPIGAAGDVAPNTRSGMLGNDSRIMFEYKINGRELKDGDYFEYYDAKGTLKATYTYKLDKFRWEIKK